MILHITSYFTPHHDLPGGTMEAVQFHFCATFIKHYYNLFQLEARKKYCFLSMEIIIIIDENNDLSLAVPPHSHLS